MSRYGPYGDEDGVDEQSDVDDCIGDPDSVEMNASEVLDQIILSKPDFLQDFWSGIEVFFFDTAMSRVQEVCLRIENGNTIVIAVLTL
jgi:hypothetical protein